MVILLDHARNAGIGSSCESVSELRASSKIGRPRPKYKHLQSSVAAVAPAGNDGKNFAVARQRRYRILYAGGEARQCEQDRSPLKRRNRLPDLWEIRSYPSPELPGGTAPNRTAESTRL